MMVICALLRAPLPRSMIRRPGASWPGASPLPLLLRRPCTAAQGSSCGY